MNRDTLRITILEDGTIKTETDDLSGPNHASADKFLKDVERLTGGESTRTRRKPSTHHHHTHTKGEIAQ
jgi:hypothetical protein